MRFLILLPLIFGIFVHAQSSIYIKTDFLFYPNSSYNEKLEGIQNFHLPVNAISSRAFPINKIYEDISIIMVSKEKYGKDSEILSVNSKDLYIYNTNIKGIDTISLTRFLRPSILSYTESVPANLTNLEQDGFQFSDNVFYYEGLTFPESIPVIKRKITESYLAMKYGITLRTDYLNSKNEIIWDLKTNTGFLENILCIGKDSRTGLNQKQSTDYEQTFAFGIGSLQKLNLMNQAEINEGSFFFVSDNGKEKVWNSESFSGTERIWKINKALFNQYKNIIFTFDYNKILQNDLLPHETIWLVWNSSSPTMSGVHADYYSTDEISENYATYQLDKLPELSDELYFSILKAPKFFAETEMTISDCENGNIKVKMVGGHSPFNLELINRNTGLKRVDVSAEDFIFHNLSAGIYELNITDASRNVYKTELSLNLTPSVEESYLLAENGEINLNVNDYLDKDLSDYWWESSANNIKEKSRHFNISKEGIYHLNYKNKNGCMQKITFIVESFKNNLLADSKVTLYPNPVKSNELFYLDINFETNKDFHIKVYAINGQLIFNKSFSNQKIIQFAHKLQQTGEYLVVLDSEDSTQSFKLIVK